MFLRFSSENQDQSLNEYFWDVLMKDKRKKAITLLIIGIVFLFSISKIYVGSDKAIEGKWFIDGDKTYEFKEDGHFMQNGNEKNNNYYEILSKNNKEIIVLLKFGKGFNSDEDDFSYNRLDINLKDNKVIETYMVEENGESGNNSISTKELTIQKEK